MQILSGSVLLLTKPNARIKTLIITVLPIMTLLLSCVSTASPQPEATAKPSVTQTRPPDIPATATEPRKEAALVARTATARAQQNAQVTSQAQETYAAQVGAQSTEQAQTTQTAQAQQAQDSQILSSIGSVIEPWDLDSNSLLPWPIPRIAGEQLTEFGSCNLNMALTADPQSACEWAAIAARFLEDWEQGRPVPEVGRQAFARAVKLNPAFAFDDRLFEGYYDTVRLVDPPPIANYPILTLVISYSRQNWQMSSPEADYTLLITQADSEPQVGGAVQFAREIDYRGVYGHPSGVNRDSFTGVVPAETVQALRTGLTDLVPVTIEPGLFYLRLPRCDAQMPAPSWSILLVMSNHTTVKMSSAGENYLVGGGPWLATVGGQTYIQYSSAFLKVLNEVAIALNLPDAPLDPTLASSTGCEVYGEVDGLAQAFLGTGE